MIRELQCGCTIEYTPTVKTLRYCRTANLYMRNKTSNLLCVHLNGGLDINEQQIPVAPDPDDYLSTDTYRDELDPGCVDQIIQHLGNGGPLDPLANFPGDGDDVDGGRSDGLDGTGPMHQEIE